MPKTSENAHTARKPHRKLVCCFTDIVGSTNIWELNEALAYSMLKRHDKILRDLVQKYQGYEVKQLGDGFFLMFENARQALGFALHANKALSSESWPLETIAMRKDLEKRGNHGDGAISRGMMIRTGLHYGRPYAIRRDPNTKLLDFNGRLINRTARIESTAEADEIAVSDELILELYRRYTNHTTIRKIAVLNDAMRKQILYTLIEPSEFNVADSRLQTLKGIRHPQNVTMLRML